MANFSKFRKYQTFGLIEAHNMSKGQLAEWIFKLWKSCVYDYQVVEHTFWHFNFSNFQTTFVKIFAKKPADFESVDKFLPIHQYLWPEFLDNETTAL